MHLHPHITLNELNQYTQLAHEHKIKEIRTTADIIRHIRHLTNHPTPIHQGIRFIQAPQKDPTPSRQHTRQHGQHRQPPAGSN